MEEDGELLQDFLIDAGEILEQLTQQAVELEKSPGDKEIINAVFRGFHTIKGGASFLALEPLVALCHRTEDVFNVLRNGERAVDAEVMDVVLPVLDILKEQFTQLSAGLPPREADLWILDKLDELASPEGRKKSRSSKPVTAKRNTQISNKKKKRNPALSAAPDNRDERKGFFPAVAAAQEKQPDLDMEEISDDEFDALLDQFQNLRQGVVYGQQSTGAGQTGNNIDTAAAPELPEDDDENITEEEFDALLDAIQRSNNKIGVNTSFNSHTPGGAADNRPVKPARAAAAGAVPEAIRETDAAPVSASAATQASNSKSRETAQAETTVRVDTKRLDDIMNLVGELVLVRNRMTSLEGLLQNEEVSKVVSNLDIVTADLQSAVMKTRMQPIKKVFGRFPRVVRDLARSLKKEVSLELQGEDTDLDKNLVEALADPLVHLVRNAVDHGIEPPDEREANGKPRKGTVILTAEQEGDHILLTIQDDGKGMDAEKIRQTAVQKGLMDEEAAARLEDKECYALTFQPGFSTKEEISDVSGRGVGMDVVKTRIEQLNGSVTVDSRKGRGSKIIIKVPLTLAIMPTLMVMVDKQIFALPLASVNEIFHLDLTKTNVVDGQLVVMVRKRALPLFYLRHWLIKGAAGTALPHEGHVVVVSMGVQRIGFVVDQLIGQEEVVIKPLGAILHGMKGLAGATITGDGRISLILDIPGLMQIYARRH
jgi:two-component system chemotaxis sensor kinase CheA